MSRDLTSGMADAIAGVVVRPVLLVEIRFKSGVGNLWTGIGPLDYDDKTWIGVGSLLSVSPIEESGEVKANGITLSLAGVKTSDIAQALSEVARNLPGKVWLGLLDEISAVIDRPKIMFRGRMDVVMVEDSAETCTISISFENELVDLERAREVRYTDEEQKRQFPDDRGLENVTALQDADIPWGARN